jgi:phage tail-like protein
MRTIRQGWLREQLPTVMAEDPFTSRFVQVFEDVATTMRERSDAIDDLFDVTVAPPGIVRFVGSWVGIEVPSSLPVESQRDLVRAAGPLLRWRGTARGIEKLVEAVTGADVTVEEKGGVFAEGEAPLRSPVVAIEVTDTGPLNEEQLLAMLRAEVPADAVLELRVAGHAVEAPSEAPDDAATPRTPDTGATGAAPEPNTVSDDLPGDNALDGDDDEVESSDDGDDG